MTDFARGQKCALGVFLFPLFYFGLTMDGSVDFFHLCKVDSVSSNTQKDKAHLKTQNMQLVRGNKCGDIISWRLHDM